MSTVSNLILTVHRFSRESGDLIVKCPHCKAIIGIEGNDLSEVAGEQYQHKKRTWQREHGQESTGCDGWFEISHDAKYSKQL